jgi:hypothetical protein
MALQLNDRVKESSITTGVVPIVLAGAPTGYQNVASSISTSNTFPYVVELVGGSEWEIGIGQYISANNSIIRTQILNSSNSSNIVNFSAGTKNVFISVPAAYIALAVRGLSQFANTTGAELASIISDTTGTGNLVFANNAVFVTPTIGIANGTSLNLTTAISSNLSLVGPSLSANLTRFPNALAVVSNTAVSLQQNETHNIGLIAEGVANASNTSIYGIGVYGVGYTNAGTRSGGVVGEGHVTSSSDGGSAIGVRGYAHDIHAGGLNVGLYGDATNGSANYALAMNNGNILSNFVQTWYLNGGLTFTGGANTVTIPNLVSSNVYFSSANGTQPFTVVSNTLVSNLNSDLLDGQHGTYYTGLTGTAFGQANTGVAIGQGAFAQANAAYNTANTKFSANGGTIFGSVTITTDLNVNGNVYLGGNVTTLSSNNLSITDPLIYLAEDNPSNLQDIGIVGSFTGNKYQHTGIVRDATDGVWKLFSNVSAEPTTTIDFSSDVIYDPLKVGSIITSNAVFSVANGTVPFIVSSNTLIPNLNVDLLDGQHGTYYTGLTGSAWNTANTAVTVAQAAYTAANTGVTVGQAAFNTANTETIGRAAFTAANTGITVGQAAYTAANTETIGRAAFNQANSAYNTANTIPALISTSIQTTNYTAAVNNLVRCNTAAGAFSVTFPASPADGSTIAILDVAGTFATNNLTLLPNGKTIESDATSVILDLNGSYASFVYNSATSNWKLLETPTGTVVPSAAGNTGNVLTSDGSNWVSLTLPNTGIIITQSAFNQANAAYTQANTGVTLAQSVLAKAPDFLLFNLGII